MKIFKKIAGYNLLVLVAYSVFLQLLFRIEATPPASAEGRPTSEAGLIVTLVMLFVLGIHVLINIVAAILSFVYRNPERGKAFLLAASIVLLVGFASCFGNAYLLAEM